MRRGVRYDPYTRMEVKTQLSAIVKQGAVVEQIETGEEADLILPESCFYIESGGQVSDQGWIKTTSGTFHVEEMKKPAAGIIYPSWKDGIRGS